LRPDALNDHDDEHQKFDPYRNIGYGKMDRWAVEPFVIAHEFLYLICNCDDRVGTIRRSHKPEFVSSKGNIHHWEITNKQTGKQQVSGNPAPSSHFR
jgi:hypothetical protein